MIGRLARTSIRLLWPCLISGLWADAASAGSALPALQPQPAGIAWPTTDWESAALPGTVDTDIIAEVLGGLFANIGPAGLPDTRALLVVHNGQIVIETYAEGFGPGSRFLSWSMAKSITNALTGVLVRKQLLNLNSPAPIDAWQADDDPRGNITLRHLLHMTTGLDNSDDAGGESGFVATMLFAPGYRTDTTTRAADVPLVHEPGSFWAYSTGNSQILGGVIHRTLGSKRETTNAFVATQLLDPLGISTLEMEFDKAGTFLAGSHMWASARDWARLGYLYLRDGVWGEQRILPEG